MKTPNENCADLEPLARLLEAGELTPTIDKIYALDQAPEAMRHLEAGQARGKIVIAVAQSQMNLATAGTAAGRMAGKTVLGTLPPAPQNRAPNINRCRRSPAWPNGASATAARRWRSR